MSQQTQRHRGNPTGFLEHGGGGEGGEEEVLAEPTEEGRADDIATRVVLSR